MVELTVPTSLRNILGRYRKQRRLKKKQGRLKREAENVLKIIDKTVISRGKSARKKRPFSLLIGPTNSAGQAHQWAGALSRRGLPAQSLRISNDPENEWFASDLSIPRLEWTALDGRVALAKRIVANFDAVLIESMRPLFSLHTLRDYSASQTFEDIHLLKQSKVKAGIVFHGSDIRDTQAHARREKFSPYREHSPELEVLQVRAREFRNAGREALKRGIPVFVTTPDLLLDIPHARWLPIAIDVSHHIVLIIKLPQQIYIASHPTTRLALNSNHIPPMKPHQRLFQTYLALSVGLWLIGSLASSPAQSLQRLAGTVHDAYGHPEEAATVLVDGPRGVKTAFSDTAGHFELNYPNSIGTLTIRATARNMESDPIRLSAQSAPEQIHLILHLSAVAQQVIVTATRSSIDLHETANTIYALTPQDLNAYPAIALDDKLRQQAGFELFRRSSSRVQNPTSQGISLRGLGSTAASRTLVLQDSVPMNDPFGGWIHWDETLVAINRTYVINWTA